MTTLEIVIVGLSAIVTSEELDCRHPMLTALKATEPIDVVLLNPGLPHPHVPLLWVRVDGLTTPPAECWHGTTDLPPAPGTSSVTTCTILPDKKWAKWDLAGKELRIVQQNSEDTTLNQGHRKLGGRCWAGQRPEPTSCKSLPDNCKKDVSWLPEYAKAGTTGRVRRAVLDDPQNEKTVHAILRDLRGDLSALNDMASDPWEWEWNYPNCGGDVPVYKQIFAQKALVTDAKTDTEALFLMDLYGEGEQVIDLAGKARIVISNLPEHPVKLIEHGNKCFLPHFDLLSTLLESVPTCRRLPYIPKPLAGCPESIGISDPFCPPVLMLKPMN